MDIEEALLVTPPPPPPKLEHCLPGHVTIVNPFLISRVQYNEHKDTQSVWFKGPGKKVLELVGTSEGYAPRITLSGSETPSTDVVVFETQNGRIQTVRVSEIEYITWVRGSLSAHFCLQNFVNDTTKKTQGPCITELSDYNCFTSVEEAVRVFREVEAAFGLPPSPHVTPDPVSITVALQRHFARENADCFRCLARLCFPLVCPWWC